MPVVLATIAGGARSDQRRTFAEDTARWNQPPARLISFAALRAGSPFAISALLS
jgi:hypothetical protein